MKKKYKDAAEKQRAYLERKKAREESAADDGAERDQCATFDLRFFGESGFEQNAQTAAEEIYIHRQFLRALGEPDVQPGETLRQLAKRCWDSLVADQGEVRGTTFLSGAVSRSGGQWIDGSWRENDDLWITMFNPQNQSFDGGPSWQGYTVRGAAKPDWFSNHWVPPEGTGDEPIDPGSLKPLPPLKLRKSESKPKPESRVPLPTVDASPIVTGLETPLEERNRLNGFGAFGVTRMSHEPG
jgi:hypothetical protein